VQDGYESDVDCGAFCGPCGFGQRCGGASDCLSRTCVPGATIPGKDTAARCLCPADQAAVTVAEGTACIDLDEVTNRRYLDFLGENPPPSPVGSPRCEGNTTLIPATGNGCPNPNDPTQASAPVVCVDFCDAEAFCLAQGKRLCAGFDGLPLATPASRVDPATSVWTAACTDIGRRKYPYTDNKEFTPNECVDQYPAPFVPSAETITVTGCAALRDDCCAFRPTLETRNACNAKAAAGNAAACDAARATECTACTALGRTCSHLLDKAAKTTCDAAVAAGDDAVCQANASVAGCKALAACCQLLTGVPERGEQVSECKKLTDAANEGRCREGLALYCPTLDAKGAVIEQTLQPTGQAAACAPRVGQPADLSGNAGEWEDNCDTGDSAAVSCTIRGGSFLGATSCAMSTWRVPRTTTQRDIGFRCCSR
jgi:formylglycine-generating enzyme required for sulfatase activity